MPRLGACLGVLLALAAAAAAAAPPAETVAPVAAMIERVIPGGAAHFALSLVDRAELPGACDSAVGECVALADLPDGRVGISGTSLPSLGFGVGTFLRARCNASLTWVKTGGLEARCTAATLPAVGAAASRVYARSVRWTYYQNVVDSSYSFAWWNFARWEKEIDWMSLVGINIGLVYTGQEKVLRDVYARFGVNLTDASGALSRGPLYISLVILRTKYTGWRQNDFNVHA